ncbi:MAG: ATP-binding cassette domain-containing protein [Candidatus Sulfobium sp.]|jgi:ABC-2 type transport system ATP-binding protein
MPSPSSTGRLLSGKENVVVARDISKSFRPAGRLIEALKMVSIEMAPGVVTGLVGPDGAGKTTLMRILTGMVVPDSGQATVLGMDATRESLKVQASIGYMPQRFGLYEDLTVEENMELYADLQGVPKKTRAGRYRDLMHMTGLGPFTSRLARRLSGGMKQKLGLACTLVRPPQLLLLDEPTVGVDPVSRRELWAIVDSLVKEEGMTVLLSTAYLDEAERCGEVVILHEGEVLGSGLPDNFRRQVKDRTFEVRAKGMKKREVQERLSGVPDVIDAIIQGDHVRLVTGTAGTPDPGTMLPGTEDVSIQPVAPRFEDSFIAMLRKRLAEEGIKASSPSPSSPLPRGGETVKPSPHAGGGEGERASIIEVHDVKRRFGDFYAVKGITFDVKRGEVFGLLGANGAGKSTTFRMLCGLLPASGGSLLVDGTDLRHSAAPARARIGYMSQKFSLYGNLSVHQNLDFFSSAYGLTGQRRAERMSLVIDQFELSGFDDMKSLDLSLGHKQRLAMACALMHEPAILFLDEPTSGVDPLARREFWHRINDLAGKGVTVLVTTHFMEEAEYCDRLAIMSAGRILALGEPEEIKARAVTAENPQPSMEDAFISLIVADEQGEAGP